MKKEKKLSIEFQRSIRAGEIATSKENEQRK
jgi:hypothetical protein